MKAIVEVPVVCKVDYWTRQHACALLGQQALIKKFIFKEKKSTFNQLLTLSLLWDQNLCCTCWTLNYILLMLYCIF